MEQGILDSITNRLDDVYNELDKYQGKDKKSNEFKNFILHVIKVTKSDIILLHNKLKKGD